MEDNDDDHLFCVVCGREIDAYNIHNSDKRHSECMDDAERAERERLIQKWKDMAVDHSAAEYRED